MFLLFRSFAPAYMERAEDRTGDRSQNLDIDTKLP